MTLLTRGCQLLPFIQSLPARCSAAASSSCAGLSPRCFATDPSHSSSSAPSQPQQHEGHEMTLQELKSIPGWLKGPVGKSILKQIGEEEWEEWIDPKTGERLWKSKKTGEVTVPGISKPDTWTEVVDKKTGLIYYWNRRTGDATSLGEAKPGAYGRKVASSSSSSQGSNPEAFGSVAGSPGKKDEQEFSILALYNNPVGYGLLGIAAFGVAMHYFNNKGG